MTSSANAFLNGNVKTEIAPLDLLLGGGLPARSMILVAGDPGTGKTVLCSQLAFAQAAHGKNTVIATITSESNEKLVSQLEGFSFFDPARLGNEVFLISAYPWVGAGPDETRTNLLRTVRERKASFLVLDGLRSIRDLWEDESKIRNFFYEMGVGLAQMNCIGIFTAEYPIEKLKGLAEATTADGIVALSLKSFGEWALRRTQVYKLRGRAHLVGEHVSHLTGDGMKIIPRLEATLPKDARTATPNSAERVSFGIETLDALLEGGVPLRSTTLLAGSTGIGKSLMALHFAAKGARAGEPAVYVSYSEPPNELIARAKAIGLDVSSLVKNRDLRIIYRPLVELESDDIANEVIANVVEMKARRLVIDGIGELEVGISNPTRARAFLTALIVHLRALDVTTVFVKEVPKIAGPDVDFSDTPAAITAENMLLLRHVEIDGKLRRLLSILKVRGSNFDDHLREFKIDHKGIHVLEPLASFDGLLTGTIRRRSDARDPSGDDGAINRGRV